MYTDILKTWIRGIGIVAVLVGVLSFPVRIGINPERDTSIFHNFADLGLIVEYAFVPIGVGIVLIVVSLLIPSGRRHEL
jgi:hypothetical protein